MSHCVLFTFLLFFSYFVVILLFYFELYISDFFFLYHTSREYMVKHLDMHVLVLVS